MLTRTSSPSDGWHLREAAFVVVARTLELTIAPPATRRGRRRVFSGELAPGLLDDADRERLCLVLLAGHCAAGGDNDDRCELSVGDLLVTGLLEHYGPAPGPNFVRSFIRQRLGELSHRAAQLVAENWDAIAAEASRLAGAE